MLVPGSERIDLAANKSIEEQVEVVRNPAKRFLVSELREHHVANIAHQVNRLAVLAPIGLVGLDETPVTGEQRDGRLMQADFGDDVVHFIEAGILSADQNVEQ